jgi:hypothetical protein
MFRFRQSSWKRNAIFAICLAGAAVTAAVERQSSDATAKPITPESPAVAAGEAEAKKLILLMDTDKNGKVSKAEFMSFMAAEFDRLDVNRDGELDVQELAKSRLSTAHRGGTHR